MTDGRADRLRHALRLYLLADTGLVPAGSLPEAVAAALRGGVTAVQLRSKDATTAELLELARAINKLCREHDVPFIVNERVDVALAAEADGAHIGHIGLEELAPTETRHLLGADAVVGVSVGSAQKARLVHSPRVWARRADAAAPCDRGRRGRPPLRVLGSAGACAHTGADRGAHLPASSGDGAAETHPHFGRTSQPASYADGTATGCADRHAGRAGRARRAAVEWLGGGASRRSHDRAWARDGRTRRAPRGGAG